MTGITVFGLHTSHSIDGPAAVLLEGGLQAQRLNRQFSLHPLQALKDRLQ